MRLTWKESRNPVKRINVFYCYDEENMYEPNGNIKVLVFVEEIHLREDGSRYYGDPKNAGRGVSVSYFVRPVGRTKAVGSSIQIKEAKQIAEEWVRNNRPTPRQILNNL